MKNAYGVISISLYLLQGVSRDAYRSTHYSCSSQVEPQYTLWKARPENAEQQQ